jgi:HPt (histidine-containing phosphotransfer) domain-containing protein
MTDADEQLAAAISALRAEYLAEAPRRLAELWSELARVQNGDASALERLGTLAHRLAGSGGAYGLPAVTDRARAADQYCRQHLGAGSRSAVEVAQLRTLIQHIADAFHDASLPE